MMELMLSKPCARWCCPDCRTSPSGLSAGVKIGKFVTIEPNCSLRSCRIGDFVKVRGVSPPMLVSQPVAVMLVSRLGAVASPISIIAVRCLPQLQGVCLAIVLLGSPTWVLSMLLLLSCKCRLVPVVCCLKAV
eukprot:GHUV01054577.1.p2 GENE.GHUV01054577.1~~GHUV01054577.1.p2  ORF type:complete len:133 (-),score=16.19 GHUV01054577.1:52-450(-)